MSKDYWKQALEEARSRREVLLDRRVNLSEKLTNIDEELGQLDQVISSLIPLAGETSVAGFSRFLEDLANIGLADACRAVLQATPDRFLSPVAIKKTLEEQGYDLKQHNNVLASIHGVLKRLVESGEAIKSASMGGTSIYKWNPVRQPKLDLGKSEQSVAPRQRPAIIVPSPKIDPNTSIKIEPRPKKKE